MNVGSPGQSDGGLCAACGCEEPNPCPPHLRPGRLSWHDHPPSGVSASVSPLSSLRKRDSGNASTGGGTVAPTQWSGTAHLQLSFESMNNGPSVRGHPTGLCVVTLYIGKA